MASEPSDWASREIFVVRGRALAGVAGAWDPALSASSGPSSCLIRFEERKTGWASSLTDFASLGIERAPAESSIADMFDVIANNGLVHAVTPSKVSPET
jgi:hypothetical protein